MIINQLSGKIKNDNISLLMNKNKITNDLILLLLLI